MVWAVWARMASAQVEAEFDKMAAFPGATIEAIRDLSVAVEPPVDGEAEA